MKKLAIFAIIIIFLMPSAASAHILKTNGSIGVTIHVDPDDDPVVGQPASFFLEIVDKQNKFDPLNCLCTAAISRAGTNIFTATLFNSSANNNLNASPFFAFTFPQKDIYTVTITGQPKSPGAFEAFSVQYDLRVSRDQAASGTAKSGSNMPLVVGIAVGLAIVAGLFLRFPKQPPKT